MLTALAQGRFDYQEQGILDRSHLRFFTRKTLVELLESSGLQVETIAANVSAEYNRMAQELAKQPPGKTDIDLGPLVLRQQSPEEIRDLFVMQFLVTARRKVFGLIEKVDDLMGSGLVEGVEGILEAGLADPALTIGERGEVEIKLGEILSRKGDLDGAFAAFSRAIPLVDDERPFQGRAVIRLLKGAFAESLIDFKKAHELNPRAYGALSGFGMVCQETGQYEDAVYYYDQSLGIEIEQEDILRLMIDSARMVGRADLALARTAEYLSLHPFKPGLKSLYAQMLEEAGLGEEALVVVREILSRDPRNPIAREILERHDVLTASLNPKGV